MSIIITFFILGLGAGAMYALFAQGLVLIYKGSSIVNFAQGAVGLLGAYIYYELRGHVPFAVALGAGVLVSAFVGLAIHVLILAPMERRGSSPLQRIIATLGVLAVVQQALLIKFGNSAINYNSIVPSRPWKLAHNLIVGSDRLYLLLIGLALSSTLWFVYRQTRFGMATTASAENSIASAALGWSPSLLKGMNWAFGGGLAGLASILLGSLTGLSPATGWLTIVPALAAAMFGAFNSFPLTFAGGILVGVLESETSHYYPKWTTATPFLVIILILVVRGKGLPLRGFLTDRLPRVGSGRPRPVLIALGTVVAVISLEHFSRGWANSVTTSAIVGVLALSLVVVTGYAGQISLAQYAMAGVGALIAGRLADAAKMPMLPAAGIAIVGTVAAGVIVGLPALRVRGVNLAIVTLGMGLAIQSVVLSNTDWTGGPIRGTVIPAPSIFGWQLESFRHSQAFAYLCLGSFLVAGLVVSNLRRGRSGRRMLAVRDNERAAASVGVSVFGGKLYAFAVASGLAGLAGVLLAFRNPNLTFSQFELFNSIALVTLAVIGGIAFIGGSVVAGTAVTAGAFAFILQNWFNVSDWYLLVTGVILLIQLTLIPDGVADQSARLYGPLLDKLAAVLRRRSKAVLADVAPSGATVRRVLPQTLTIRNVTVRFSGVQALDDVSLEVRPGEVVGLIGPNGAGKTTLIDVATGFVRPTRGEVVLNDLPITRASVHARARGGVVRSWQSLELFEALTVLENLVVASEPRDRLSYFKDLVHPSRVRLDEHLEAIIDELELREVLNSRASDLSYAQRHLVSIARAMASAASVLLLDEPTAGLDDSATSELGRLVRRLAEDWGIAVLLIEHDVPMVMGTCDRIVVLKQGGVIAEGTPAEMRGNPAVVDAYLGTPAKELTFEGSAKLMAKIAAEEEVAGAECQARTANESATSTTEPALLRASGASAGYGKRPVIEGIDLHVRAGEVVALLGANGAGKTTTLRMLAGVLPVSRGSVSFDGSTTKAPLHRRARRGLAYVTEERSIFRALTTEQNLMLGRGPVESALEAMPELRPLLSRRAGVLSGGEQQMLALGRSLASRPKVLLADELSLGLGPIIVQRLFQAVRAAADDGTGVLLVEQQARAVLPFCDRAFVLRRGQVVMAVEANEFADRLSEIEEMYLWAGAPESERLVV